MDISQDPNPGRQLRVFVERGRSQTEKSQPHVPAAFQASSGPAAVVTANPHQSLSPSLWAPPVLSSLLRLSPGEINAIPSFQ